MSPASSNCTTQEVFDETADSKQKLLENFSGENRRRRQLGKNNETFETEAEDDYEASKKQPHSAQRFQQDDDFAAKEPML